MFVKNLLFKLAKIKKYFMYITGYNSLFQCTMIQHLRRIIPLTNYNLIVLYFIKNKK